MICINCGRDRILQVSGKVSDSCFLRFAEQEHDGYVPSGLAIGSSDYLEFNLCMNCGQVQHTFPIEDINLDQD
jgi:hypothetical protein